MKTLLNKNEVLRRTREARVCEESDIADKIRHSLINSCPIALDVVIKAMEAIRAAFPPEPKPVEFAVGVALRYSNGTVCIAMTRRYSVTSQTNEWNNDGCLQPIRYATDAEIEKFFE